MAENFFNKIRRSFITGLLVLLPVFLTVTILTWVIKKINLWFLEPFVRFVEPYTGSFFIILALKLALFFIIVIIIILCGVATRVIFVRKFFGWGEWVFTKMPLVSKVYNAIKEISAALFGKKRGVFKKVVVVEFPRPGLYSIGFITCEHIDRTTIKKEMDDDLASVFVPTTPNPTTGFFMFVRKKELIDVDLSTEDAFKLILSGGTISPYSSKRESQLYDT
ncbi:MAG: DUF502 domain-containing protein [Candidatus Omnitrophica bacterium]|nr:DUF502 domain-containing protein [Candidatus Omnitrophota bacterium]